MYQYTKDYTVVFFIEMARPKLTSLTIFSVFLLSTRGYNSVFSSSCTVDCAPFIPGAVAYWPMTNETKGSDLSGNNNHATFVGLTYTDGPPGVYLKGEDNGAVHFNGSGNSFANVNNSQSMNVGKYPGFSFCGYFRYFHFGIENKSASLISWSSEKRNGVFIFATSKHIQIHLYPMHSVVKHKAEFPKHKLKHGEWHFIGVSYDKETGIATAYQNDGIPSEERLDTFIAGGTSKTEDVGLGVDLADPNDYNYNGDMSCVMLLKFAITKDDFEKVWRFCSTRNSTQKTLPNITVSGIAATKATASWTKSPGIFSGYNITIERNQSELDRESVHPQFIPTSIARPQSVLSNLVPGAKYRVHVWHMQRDIVGRARTSAWFVTELVPVNSESIYISDITATSANVTWEEVTGNFDGYSVDISPTTGGAKAYPSRVLKGNKTTSLKNLSPGRLYKIKIRTTIGNKTSLPSKEHFQTLDLVPVNSTSINISDITATSANVTWEEVTSNFYEYFVDISPTTGGAMADPSTVLRGNTTTSLKNLSPGRTYTITIQTKIGSRMSCSSMKAFLTLDRPTTIEYTALVLAVICLVVSIVSGALIMKLWQTRHLPTRKGDKSNNPEPVDALLPLPESQ